MVMRSEIERLKQENEYNYNLIGQDIKELDEEILDLKYYTDNLKGICVINRKIILFLLCVNLGVNISFFLIYFLLLHQKAPWIYRIVEEHQLGCFQVRTWK